MCAEQNFSELRPNPYRYFTVKPLSAIFLFQLLLCCCICYFNRLKKKLLRFHWEGDCSVLIIHMLQN